MYFGYYIQYTWVTSSIGHSALMWVCRLLTEEVGRKATAMSVLDQEKSALIRDLFQVSGTLEGITPSCRQQTADSRQ